MKIRIALVGVCTALGLVLPVLAADSGPAGAATTPAGIVRQALALGDPAPALAVTDLQGKPVTLESLRGKPVILQFGSLTDPIFRRHAPAAEKLAASNKETAAFLIVYQREAHPADGNDPLQINANEGFALAAPTTPQERTKLASQAAPRLNIVQQTLVVDAWNDTTAQRYGGLPNMTFLIDAQGRLAAAYPWMDVPKLEGALSDVLAGNPVAAAHRGPVRSTTAAIVVADNDETGPAHFAAVIDNLHLTDAQKTAVYPVLADFVTELRTIRENRTSSTQPATNAASRPAPGAALARIRDAVDNFKTRLKPLLTDVQYSQLVDGINRPPGVRPKATPP